MVGKARVKKSSATSRLIGLALCLLVAGASGFGLAGVSEAAAPYVTDELLVQSHAGVPVEVVDGLLNGLGAESAGEIAPLRIKRIKVPEQALDRVKTALARNPHIKFVENNFLARGSFTPNDRYYPSQWHLPKISAPQGWDFTTGSSSVPLAIIDSGVDPTHPDLAGKLLSGYSFLAGNSDTHDVLGHGTAVAGTAAAIANNGAGVAGVAWQNPIMPLVVLDATDYASYYNIAQAITYAANHEIKVMNISIGGSSASSTMQNAVNYAWNKGAIIFASAMNNATSSPYYPAACANVVAVSATTSSDTLAGFSNYGNWVSLSAPGVSIYTTTNGGGYGSWSGTSFSSPMTAGLAALVISANSSLSNVQVLDILKQNADDLGASGFDPSFGYGRINAYKSLAAAINAVPQPDETAPVVAIASPTDGAAVIGTITVSVTATDNVGVTKVDLYLDGSLYATDVSNPFTFSWDSSRYPDGVSVLQAYAYDASGNVGQSKSVTVTVSNPRDITPPTVSITSPAAASYVGTKATVTVVATDNGGISRIELYLDNVLKSTTTNQNSLSWLWSTRKEKSGAHTLVAKAWDASGNAGTSSITVYK